MTRIAIILILFFLSASCFSQQQEDTAVSLQEINVKAFEANVLQMRVPAAVSVISPKNLVNTSSFSLLPAFNQLAGLRMEERSPGSYRLSIRGSLLRSPFGVRNVKIYLDDFILTDAGGNTYLNLLDVHTIGNAEVIKGPAGSIYGAGTAGAVLLSSPSLFREHHRDTTAAKISLSGGSFGAFNQAVHIHSAGKGYALQLTQAHSQSDGYREQSRLRKDNIQLRMKISGNEKMSTDVLVLLSDLFYQTPGGLTLAQMKANPRQSRPATPTLPSVKQQKTSIRNQTALLGFSTTHTISNQWKVVNAFTSAFTGFSNPFITNYEKRNEVNVGLRSKFVYEKKEGMPLQWVSGVEVQKGDYRIDSTGNKAGVRDDNLVRDAVSARQQFVFSQLSISPLSFFQIQTGFSYNVFNNTIERTIGAPARGKVPVDFKGQLLPRVAVMINPLPLLGLYLQVSKGYASPTVAEIRPSAGGLYAGLQAESGWNREVGLKWTALKNRFSLSAVFFDFNLRDAVVRQTNASGAEYFINSGSVRQKGFEGEWSWLLINKPQSGLFRHLRLMQAVTLNDFRFADYKANGADYSGKKLTGVPDQVLSTNIEAGLLKKFYLHVNTIHVEKLPLNDANSFYADPYWLTQLKLGWQSRIFNKPLDLYLLVDNLADVQYSLGNDINAFGARFFNPAAGRNFIAGCTIRLK